MLPPARASNAHAHVHEIDNARGARPFISTRRRQSARGKAKRWRAGNAVAIPRVAPARRKKGYSRKRRRPAMSLKPPLGR